MIYQGNAFDLFSQVADNSIDAVITDPPYGTTACRWDSVINLDDFWVEVKRVLKTPHSPVVVFADQPFTSNLVMSNPKWFRHDWIWKKPQVSGALQARNKPFKFTEDIVVFSEQTPRYFIDDLLEDANPNIVIKRKKYRHATGTNETRDGGIYTPAKTNYPKETLHYAPVRAKSRHDNTKHPTQKPEDLMEFLVSIYTQEGDVVLDPFMGSGTTGIAAQNLNRQFIGVEQDKFYYEMAKARMMANV